jgi:proline dehydrogenase
MGLLRNALLAGADSAWLRRQAPRYPFVRRTVSRFMPGEHVEDALAAAERLRQAGISTLLTHLGENLTTAAEAEAVRQHYQELMDAIDARRLDAQVSVKLTQLGLDLSAEACYTHTSSLAARANRSGKPLWIDMESSAYTDRTLEMYRRLREGGANVGVAVQAYLRRTTADLTALMPLGPSIRLVKGAYREPPAIAFPDKKDVDENFYTLAARLLGAEGRAANVFTGIATHDVRLIDRIQAFADSDHAPQSSYEYELLYGIQRAEQVQLARAGRKIRVLISYGEFWFPWFMRRLAERPANVLFVARNLFTR